MKNILLLTIGLLTFFCSNAQIGNGISDKQAHIIFEKTKLFPENTELSIAFINNGRLSYYGVKRVNDTLEYINNSNSLFEIGSITKIFTTTLLANFILAHKIKLNDEIQDYLNFTLKNNQITVLQLANHTSGLPRLPSNLDLDAVDQSNPYKNYTVDDLKKYLTEELALNHAPGSTYDYSNIGVGLLGYLLENVTDTTYEELLQKYIFSKYKMNNTTTDTNRIKLKLVNGLDSNGNKTSNWSLNALVGAGGILSNIEDLSKFAIAQFNIDNKELELTRKSTFEIPEYQMEVGLAWNIIQTDSKQKWHMHNGGTGGYSSIMALDIESENGVIILSNVSSFHENARNLDQLCLGLMKNQYK